MLIVGTGLLVLASVTQADPKKLSVEEVHARPYSYEGNRLILCGEVSDDGSVLYSETIYRFHGRAGVTLRGVVISALWATCFGQMAKRLAQSMAFS